MLLPTAQPLDSAEQDRLNRVAMARLIAELVSRVTPPFTIGLYGEWGSGKTTILRFTDEIVTAADPNTLTVWFNTWQYDSGLNLMFALFQALDKSIAASQGKRTDSSRRRSKRIGKAILIASADAATTLMTGGTATLASVREINSALETQEVLHRRWTDTVKNLRDDLEQLVTEFMRASGDHGGPTRICVFVDDLDRCSPAHALALIEGMHLFFNIPGLVFVLAISPATIKHAVASKYGEDANLIQMYHEKLVNLEVYVPVPDTHLAQFLESLSLLRSEDSPGGVQFAAFNEGVLLARIANPRLLKRIFSKLLVVQQAFAELSPQHQTELAYLVVIRHAWPPVYELLSKDPAYVNVISRYLSKGPGQEAERERLGAKADLIDGCAIPIDFWKRVAELYQLQGSLLKSSAGLARLRHYL